jgi:threonine dehydratase
MPSDAPRIKRSATEGYGAEIVEYDRSETTREALARTLSEERGLPIIPPYDHPHIVAGQGTAALELFEDCRPLDALVVCCGGGGLLSGSSIVARHVNPDVTVVGVEPANADDAARSFRSGEIQTVENPDTVADGARTPYLGAVTFPIIMKNVDDFATVSERSIVEAMYFMWERMKIVVEPTGALALSALLDGTLRFPGANVGVIVSGGNVDIPAAAKLFAELNG